METIYNLLHDMPKGERISFLSMLKCVTPNNKNKDNKTLRLALFLLNCKKHVPRNAECMLNVYGKKIKGNNIYNLKSILENKLLDFIICGTNLSKQEEMDEQDVSIIMMKKRAAQFQRLLYSKSSVALKDKILNEIIQTSLKYEYYYGAAEHLRIKKLRTGTRNGAKAFKKIEDESKKASECMFAVDTASDYYTFYISVINTQAITNPIEVNKFLKDAIDDLSNLFRKSNSKMVLYYKTLLEVAFLESNLNYERAHDKILEHINIVRNNVSVYRKQRIGIALANLSECEMYLKHFNEAALTAKQALSYFPFPHFNYTRAQEQIFYSFFYGKNYKKAYKVLKQITENGKRDEVGNFTSDKYIYFLAAIYFMKKNFTKTIQILSTKQEIENDKEGWAIACRMLHIMALAEKGTKANIDAATERLECLRKAMEKLPNKNKRRELIFECLVLLGRQGFDFKNSKTKIFEKLELLANNKERELRWNMQSPELIPFHQWINSKIKRKIAK